MRRWLASRSAVPEVEPAREREFPPPWHDVRVGRWPFARTERVRGADRAEAVDNARFLLGPDVPVRYVHGPHPRTASVEAIAARHCNDVARDVADPASGGSTPSRGDDDRIQATRHRTRREHDPGEGLDLGTEVGDEVGDDVEVPGGAATARRRVRERAPRRAATREVGPDPGDDLAP